MKKYVLSLCALALCLSACNSNEDSFKVNVSLANANDKTVYLQKFVDNAPVVIDSAVITNETASMTAKKDDPQILYALKVKGMRGSMPFFADNNDVAFVGDLNNPQAVAIMASATQAELDAYNDEVKKIDLQIRDLYNVMQQAFLDNDSILMDSLNKVGNALNEQQDSFRDEYIMAHPESFVTHYILDQVKQDYPLDQLKAMVATFTTESIYKTDLDDYIAKQERLEVGQPFIDFTLQTKDGEQVTLADVVAKNKVTMVDFWASWCGPCRHENPVVKAAYEQYHALGFDVVAVSVDQDEAAWIEAVEQDQLPYTQVRDSENAVSQDYMIYYIPANFLFDQDGNMIAKGLRGEELGAKLAEILK